MLLGGWRDWNNMRIIAEGAEPLSRMPQTVAFDSKVPIAGTVNLSLLYVSRQVYQETRLLPFSSSVFSFSH